MLIAAMATTTVPAAAIASAATDFAMVLSPAIATAVIATLWYYNNWSRGIIPTPVAIVRPSRWVIAIIWTECCNAATEGKQKQTKGPNNEFGLHDKTESLAQ